VSTRAFSGILLFSPQNRCGPDADLIASSERTNTSLSNGNQFQAIQLATQ
jgi:hypothetical protein